MSEIRFYIDKEACNIYESPVALIPNKKTFETFELAKKQLVIEYNNDLIEILDKVEKAKKLENYISINVTKKYI